MKYLKWFLIFLALLGLAFLVGYFLAPHKRTTNTTTVIKPIAIIDPTLKTELDRLKNENHGLKGKVEGLLEKIKNIHVQPDTIYQDTGKILVDTIWGTYPEAIVHLTYKKNRLFFTSITPDHSGIFENAELKAYAYHKIPANFEILALGKGFDVKYPRQFPFHPIVRLSIDSPLDSLRSTRFSSLVGLRIWHISAGLDPIPLILERKWKASINFDLF